MKFTVVGSPGSQSVTALINGELHSATEDNPKFGSIVDACKAGTATEDMFSLKSAVEQYLSLSDRISLSGGRLYFDGDEVHSELSNIIVRMYQERAEVWPLVRFMESLYQNPSEGSREQLFDWLRAAGDGFGLATSGMVIGYKKLIRTQDGYKSVHSGTAAVNGYVHTGQIPQTLGDTVTMPRSHVTADPEYACSVGLHVGTFNHAREFSGDVLVAVAFWPRDVVSVPAHDNTKIRVCKYVLLEEVSEPYKTFIAFDSVGTPSPDLVDFAESSWLSKAEYRDGTMIVTLRNGKTYTHRHVAKDTWSEFATAYSPGQFYNDNFKNQ